MFSPSQFTPTKWDTREDKAAFANALVAFIEEGFPKARFTPAIYGHLSNCFGHIAHYTRQGFYEEWFVTELQRLEFLQNMMRYICCGTPNYTFCDVEKALQGWVHKADAIDKAAEKLRSAVEKRELAELERLKAKYESTA